MTLAQSEGTVDCSTGTEAAEGELPGVEQVA